MQANNCRDQNPGNPWQANNCIDQNRAWDPTRPRASFGTMKRQRQAKVRAVIVNRIDAYFQLHPAVPNHTTNGRYVQSLRQALLGKVNVPVNWTPEDVTAGVCMSKHQWVTCKVDAGRPRRMLNRMLAERAQIDSFLHGVRNVCGGSKADASTGLDLPSGPCIICAQVPTEVTYTTCEPPPHATRTPAKEPLLTTPHTTHDTFTYSHRHTRHMPLQASRVLHRRTPIIGISNRIFLSSTNSDAVPLILISSTLPSFR